MKKQLIVPSGLLVALHKGKEGDKWRDEVLKGGWPQTRAPYSLLYLYIGIASMTPS